MAKLLKRGDGSVADWGDAQEAFTGGFELVGRGGQPWRSRWFNSQLTQFSLTVEDGSAPAPSVPPASPWAGCQPMRPDSFPAACAYAIGAAKFAAIEANAKTSWIWSMIMAPTQEMIDPLDSDFQTIVAFLSGATAFGATAQLTSPTDDAIMLTNANIAALISVFAPSSSFVR